MKTYEQLMTHYWGKIVPMAEVAGIKPWECVKVDIVVFGKHPTFRETHPEDYTFALTVLESKPVFVGDEFYSSTGTKFKIREFTDKFNFEGCTWTPPAKKRTFMLELTEKQLESLITITRPYCTGIYMSEVFKLLNDAATRSNQNVM